MFNKNKLIKIVGLIFFTFIISPIIGGINYAIPPSSSTTKETSYVTKTERDESVRIVYLKPKNSLLQDILFPPRFL